MSKVEWTTQQQDAIDSHSPDILVSAGAGSGKTAVLIERLMRKIKRDESPLSVNRLLLVTYTNEAASQLKEKIRNAISDAMAEDPTNNHLNRQYLLLPQATITTIHGFCLEIVKKYHAKLGLPPKIKPADDVQSDLLMCQVADTVIDGYYSSLKGYDDIDDFVSFADNFITLQDSKLTETLIGIYNKLREMPEGIDFILKSVNEYEKAESSLAGTIWADLLLNMMKRHFTYFHAVMSDACEEFDDGDVFAENKLEYYEKHKEACATIIDLCEKGDFEGLSEALDRNEFNESKEKKVSKEFWYDRANYFKKARVELRAISREYKKLFIDVDKDIISSTAKQSRKAVSDLHKLLTAFDKRYTFEKKRRGIVDFSDIIRYAYSLLIDENGEATEIALEVADQYDEVCIDEYQDVNKIQDDIFTAISKTNNRFMVGDIKQSIYGFRGSMPEIFAAYRRSHKVSHIDLNANFRCDEPIINFSNDVCSVLFKNLGHTFEYTDEDDLKYRKKDGGKEPVEVICISKDTDEDCEEQESGEEIPDLEVRYIAKRIKEEIDSGTKPSEIAVLAMTKASFKPIIDELERYNVMAKDATPPDLLSSPEVVVLLCILQAIDNPSKDIPLVGALKSPVFNFSVSDLTLIRNSCNEPTFYHSLLKYTEENDFPKGRHFINKLNEYRAMINEPVDKLIWHVLHDSGLMYLSVNENGRDGEDKLLAFYEFARTYENGSFKGLYSFLRSINDSIDAGGTLSAPKKPDGDNVVKIMTVHKSKGLEFDTVFLCNTSKAFSNKEIMKPCLINSKSGVSLKLSDSTGLVSYAPVFKTIANKAYYLERDDECIRCLYVALTRAKRKLITVGTVKSEEVLESLAMERRYVNNSNGYVFTKNANFLSWMLLADPKIRPIFITESDIKNGASSSDNKGPDVSDNSGDNGHSTEEIERLSDIYKKRFSFEYPDREAQSIPAKLSVSKLYPAVLDEYDDSKNVSAINNAKLSTPSFISSKERSGTDIGTATHQFMQFCSFENLADTSVEVELKRLTEKGFLDPLTASLVNVSDVERFVSTELFNSLLNSNELRRELRFNVRFKASSFTENEETAKALENETVLVQGIIDCIYKNADDTYIVLDYKTDSTNKCSSEEEAEEMLIDRHLQQLSYYKRATEIITGKKVSKVMIYSFSLGRTVEIPKERLLAL